jgi:hypothetical protein
MHKLTNRLAWLVRTCWLALVLLNVGSTLVHGYSGEHSLTSREGLRARRWRIVCSTIRVRLAGVARRGRAHLEGRNHVSYLERYAVRLQKCDMAARKRTTHEADKSAPLAVFC